MDDENDYYNYFDDGINEFNKVHISYKHLMRHTKAIDNIYHGLQEAGISVSIDKHDVEIRDSIREYEDEIGHSKHVIVVITPEYLHSIQCMYELKEIIKNGDIRRRITAIVEIDDISRDADGLRKIIGRMKKNVKQNKLRRSQDR